MDDLKNCLLDPSATLSGAMTAIDTSKGKIALVIDSNRRLVGTVTDGDVRRALLNGAVLSDLVASHMNTHPRTATQGHDSNELLSFMRREQVRHVPIVNDSGVLVDLCTLTELVSLKQRSNWVMLMAGGEGRRLRPLTEDLPKPMLKVGPKPILETIIDRFVEAGFQKFFLCVNYKSHMIEDYFGDGSARGIEIAYLREEEPLGTAGPLSLLPDRPSAPLIVMNGDILTNVSLPALLEFHQERQSFGTMCVREYRAQVPYGVVDVDGYSLRNIVEKPWHTHFVNAGIYVLEPESLDLIPPVTEFSMPSLFKEMVVKDRSCAVFPISEYWLDIGRHDDFERANREFWELFE